MSLSLRCVRHEWGVVIMLVGSACHRANEMPQQAMTWPGCWGISMKPQPPHASDLLVRLDSVPATARTGVQEFWGVGIEGFHAAPPQHVRLTWFGGTQDTLHIETVGLGGVEWDFTRHGDSLIGAAFETYDIVDTRTNLGRATARRQDCPTS
jgi:hypothetical protein